MVPLDIEKMPHVVGTQWAAEVLPELSTNGLPFSTPFFGVEVDSSTYRSHGDGPFGFRFGETPRPGELQIPEKASYDRNAQAYQGVLWGKTSADDGATGCVPCTTSFWTWYDGYACWDTVNETCCAD